MKEKGGRRGRGERSEGKRLKGMEWRWNGDGTWPGDRKNKISRKEEGKKNLMRDAYQPTMGVLGVGTSSKVNTAVKFRPTYSFAASKTKWSRKAN